MKAVLLIVTTMFVGYSAIGAGVSATDHVEQSTARIESVLNQATR